jgi:hypothetical protein
MIGLACLRLRACACAHMVIVTHVHRPAVQPCSNNVRCISRAHHLDDLFTCAIASPISDRRSDIGSRSRRARARAAATSSPHPHADAIGGSRLARGCRAVRVVIAAMASADRGPLCARRPAGPCSIPFFWLNGGRGRGGLYPCACHRPEPLGPPGVHTSQA